MTVDQAIRVVQMAYPQIYLACHTRHHRKRTTEHRLSQRDAAILAHLDETAPTVPGRLARHMGIGRSTLSEALKRLVELGYTRRTEDDPDGRLTSVVLTTRGARAIRETSSSGDQAIASGVGRPRFARSESDRGRIGTPRRSVPRGRRR